MNFRKADADSCRDRHMLVFKKNAVRPDFSWEVHITFLPVFLCVITQVDFLLLLFLLLIQYVRNLKHE